MFFYEKLNGHQFSFQFLLAELNTFYLKFVLWIPPPHFLCLGRLVFFVFMGACAMREGFQYMDDPWVLLYTIDVHYHEVNILCNNLECKMFWRFILWEKLNECKFAQS